MPDHPQLSLVQQCQLLQIARSSLYYQPKAPVDEELELLRLIDQQYLETPCYGSRKMALFLQPCGYRINRKRTQHDSFFTLELPRLLIQRYQVHLIVYEPAEEVIVLWKK
ncbi:hypothetical protein HJG54_21620 [Leptolyngbya sp. NK1-12]|uniref:Uncharacterized protein n=1 Tax=Leptolyngbya sp. NK1-12 TaxID=2547451 RepID=A0AA96WFE7_9CYAN|nr:hypothetical protein [Leptolyngbya sp. NK1-12]WNZ21396.1 hypothetical protein HJG54_21620 [Leptolyngbya sp. NK1-12]